jgi:hypothetical protein
VSFLGKMRERTSEHQDTCECYDCSFLAGYGATETSSPLLLTVMAVLDGYKYSLEKLPDEY